MIVMCSNDHKYRSLSQDCQDLPVLLHLLDPSVSIASECTTPSLTVIRIPTRSQGSRQITSGATNSAATTLVFSTTKSESSLTCALIVKLWLGSLVLRKLWIAFVMLAFWNSSQPKSTRMKSFCYSSMLLFTFVDTTGIRRHGPLSG